MICGSDISTLHTHLENAAT